MTKYAINELNINDRIALDDSSYGLIVDIKKGWIKLESGRKIRAKQVLEVLEPESNEVDEGDEEVISRMQKALDDARPRYFKTVSASGNISYINGDPVAELLEGMDHFAVAAVADRVFEMEAGYHRERYAGLNAGQVRMNSGNRIRAALKRGELTIDELRKHVGR